MHRQEPRSAVRAIATVSLHVPRGEPGDLEDGIQAVIERVDSVHRATVIVVRRVSPVVFDLDVTARVAMTIDASQAFDGLRETLLDGFGIFDVRELQVDN